MDLSNPSPISPASLLRRAFFQTSPEQEVSIEALRQLFICVIAANKEEVEKILDANPHLALAIWNATSKDEEIMVNKGGQRIYVQGKTAYQFALGEEDPEICKIFKKTILKVANKKEADKRFLQQYPINWQEEEKKRWALVFIRLPALIQAIRMASPGDLSSSGAPDYNFIMKPGSDIESKYSEYTRSLNALLNEAVTTGRHFNPNLLLKTFEEYRQYDKDIATDQYNDGYNKACDPLFMFFWRSIIGGVQRIMPVNWMHLFCDPRGLEKVAEILSEEKPLLRACLYTLQGHAIQSVYPLSEGKGVGFDVTIIKGQGWISIGGIPSCQPLINVIEFKRAAIQKLCDIKAQESPKSKSEEMKAENIFKFG